MALSTAHTGGPTSPTAASISRVSTSGLSISTAAPPSLGPLGMPASGATQRTQNGRTYRLDEEVTFEEDAQHEFKRCSDAVARRNFVSGGNITKNVVGFLNSTDGGTIYLGVDDDGIVKGVVMGRAKRDKFRLAMNQMLRSITPAVLPSLLSISFVPVIGDGTISASPSQAPALPPLVTGGGVASTDDDDEESAAAADISDASDAASIAPEAPAGDTPPNFIEWRAARKTGESRKEKRAVYMATYGHLTSGRGSTHDRPLSPHSLSQRNVGESDESPSSDDGGDHATDEDDDPPTPLPRKPSGDSSSEEASRPRVGHAPEPQKPGLKKKHDRCFRCDRTGHGKRNCWAVVNLHGGALDPATAAARPVASSPQSPTNSRVVVEVFVSPALSPAQPIPYETVSHVAYCRRDGETGTLSGPERFQLTELARSGKYATTAAIEPVTPRRKRKVRSSLCTIA
eukprot:m.131213 g.131213  ORF g.131213 m.131213 type:complete len:457 (+) comp22415_c0_seq1:336-1706(+)